MLKNIIYLLAVQGGNYIFPLITLPYLVRVLEPTGYGIY
ncbi:TPA: oligosaccharide flippase family protein, partial [Salmonella enterica subsp. enterica serovar Hvittingfoss]|nr:oligosaccharide flippase family protein [Salmonella enterica subsp. enterica serovar Hvittingfoss]EEK9858879.1 oligosaccharide flippase family protein [Salmonella enterica]